MYSRAYAKPLNKRCFQVLKRQTHSKFYRDKHFQFPHLQLYLLDYVPTYEIRHIMQEHNGTLTIAANRKSQKPEPQPDA